MKSSRHDLKNSNDKRLIPRIYELRQTGLSYLKIRSIIFEEFNRNYETETIKTYSRCDMDLSSDNENMARLIKEYETLKPEIDQAFLDMEEMFDQAKVRGLL